MIAWVRRVKVRLLFAFGLQKWPHPPPFTVHWLINCPLF